MKTAMQRHIEHLKIMQNMVSEKSLNKELTETINTTLSGAIENAEHFIETEKQQIIDAYIQGYCHCEYEGVMDTEAYYTSTYTPNK